MTIIRKKLYRLLRILDICHTIVVIIKVKTIKNDNDIELTNNSDSGLLLMGSPEVCGKYFRENYSKQLVKRQTII
jgi:hypothetical protein